MYCLVNEWIIQRWWLKRCLKRNLEKRERDMFLKVKIQTLFCLAELRGFFSIFRGSLSQGATWLNLVLLRSRTMIWGKCSCHFFFINALIGLKLVKFPSKVVESSSEILTMCKFLIIKCKLPQGKIHKFMKRTIHYVQWE